MPPERQPTSARDWLDASEHPLVLGSSEAEERALLGTPRTVVPHGAGGRLRWWVPIAALLVAVVAGSGLVWRLTAPSGDARRSRHHFLDNDRSSSQSGLSIFAALQRELSAPAHDDGSQQLLVCEGSSDAACSVAVDGDDVLQVLRDRFSRLADGADEPGKQAAPARSMAVRAVQRSSCVDLPGVLLDDAEGGRTLSVTVLKGVSTSDRCSEWCSQITGCKQSIFSLLAKGCYLYGNLTTEVRDLGDGYNSSLCGTNAHQVKLLAKVVRSHRPELHTPIACSWEGEDCRETKCCNEPVRSYFEGRSGSEGGMRCFSINRTWATCAEACLPEARGGCKVLGRGRPSAEVGRAEEGQVVKGTSLFCFTAAVSTPYLSRGVMLDEASLLRMQKAKGIGIFACDGHLTLRGHESSSGEGWSSYLNNVEAFAKHWEAVRKEGQWQKHDWTVKVDADAVLFPASLRARLVKLRTPWSASVYIKNSNSRSEFSGSLEVLTSEAVAAYFDGSDECRQHLQQQGGEDRYMKFCLDALGVGFQVDHDMLREGASATPSRDACPHPDAAAFHPFKTGDSWMECHEAHLAKATGGPAAADASAGTTSGAAPASSAVATTVTETRTWPTAVVTHVTTSVADVTVPKTTVTLTKVTTTLMTTSTATETTLPPTSTDTTATSSTKTITSTWTMYVEKSRTATTTTVTETATDTNTTGTTRTTAVTETETTATTITTTTVAPTGTTVTTQSTTSSAPFDCQDGADNVKDWVLKKAIWCCHHNGVGCIGSPQQSSKPYDCQEGLEDWENSWVLAKSLWCCKNEGVGCMQKPKLRSLSSSSTTHAGASTSADRAPENRPLAEKSPGREMNADVDQKSPGSPAPRADQGASVDDLVW